MNVRDEQHIMEVEWKLDEMRMDMERLRIDSYAEGYHQGYLDALEAMNEPLPEGYCP